MTAPPIPSKWAHFITQHGITRRDEFYWMRERENPEVMTYLLAENAYLDKVLEHTRPLQEELLREMKGRIKEEDSTVPERIGDYFYYKRYEPGKQYAIYCRKNGSLEAAEELLLDQNVLALESEFCSIGAFSVSPDGKKLAYSLDTEGAEAYTIHVKNLLDGSSYPETIKETNGSVYFQGGVEWANDSNTFYYSSLDAVHRSDKLYRHRLGTDPLQDQLLYHEADEAYALFVFKTRSLGYIMIYHYNTLSPEMSFISADDPEAPPKVLQPRTTGLEYFATHHGDFFYIVTNDNARNFRLMRTPVSRPAREHWEEVIPHREDVLLDHVDAFEDYLILHERKNGLKQLRVNGLEDVSSAKYVGFPEPAYDINLENNPEFSTKLLRFKYSSLITPYSVVDYHMDTGEWELKKQDEIPSGYDRSQYCTERIFAAAPDGTQIPISLAYKKSLEKDGNNPTLLYGYGAYGASSDANFNSNLISLFDRGFVFAIAHVRGGSEMGRSWYESGRLLNKKNTFTDFIACAEQMIMDGYTSKERLAITGSSAGGLLVGACMTLRPDLFKAVICKVPFLDVVTSMSDPSIPLVTLEYDQWGNPEDRDTFDYMLSYSPYDNIRPVHYPDILLTSGFNDPRVAYWEPAKFAARLRDIKKGSNLVLLQTNLSAGHAGASGRYESLQESVLDYAFLIDRIL